MISKKCQGFNYYLYILHFPLQVPVRNLPPYFIADYLRLCKLYNNILKNCQQKVVNYFQLIFNKSFTRAFIEISFSILSSDLKAHFTHKSVRIFTFEVKKSTSRNKIYDGAIYTILFLYAKAYAPTECSDINKHA